MGLFISGWLFILGLAIGSFISVIVYRTINGESPWKGRSHCDHCGKLVDWKHNIPLLSFILLRGKCVNCKTKISWQYPIVELLTGLLFVWWYWVGQSVFMLVKPPFVVLQPLFWLIIGVLMLMVIIYDLAYSLIPDFISLPLVALTFAYRLFLGLSGEMRWLDMWTSLIAGLVLAWFFYGLYLLTNRKGFGLGDVKMAPALGLLLGWQKMTIAVFLAFVIGATVGVLLMSIGKKRFGQTIPFGPFLVLGSAISLLWGPLLWNWYWAILR